MSLRAFGLGLSAAAAFSAVAVLEAPVQAASIANKTLSFTGSARLDQTNASTFRLNFTDFADTVAGTAEIAAVSNPVFGASGTSFTIGDLNLVKTTDTTWELAGGNVTNWLTGLPNSVGFTLESFSLQRVLIPVLVGGSEVDVPFFVTGISGVFTPSNLGGTGFLTAQGSLRFEEGSSFSANVTAIPTPALLPGLVGLGVAAFRKRNGQDSSEQEV